MNLIKHVNIEVGTKSTYRQSNGNTLPLVQYPFGAQGYAMQTDQNNGGWFYNPDVNYTEGVRFTNQPSPWLGDYGHLVVMPFVGNINIDSGSRHSSIINKKLSPSEMSFHMNRYCVDFKLTPHKYGGKIVCDFETTKETKFLIQCFDGESTITFEKNMLKVTTKTCHQNEFSSNFVKYYGFKFDQDIIDVKYYHKNKSIEENTSTYLSAVVILKSSFKIDFATSYIDFEQLNYNMQDEKTYEEILTNTSSVWNDYLSTIKIDENQENKDLFYSNLYRCFLFPRSQHEVNEENQQVHKSFYTNKVEKGPMYVDNGFWDTYRTTFPLLKLLVPEIYKNIIEGIILFYNQSGWLPRWVAPYERGIMPSTLTDSVVSEAIVSEMVPDYLLDDAIEALLKDANEISNIDINGRKNIKEYLELGFVPYDKSHESVSMTLDNAYSDYAISQALKKVGNTLSESMYKRSMNYKNLFNQETLFFERKDSEKKFDKTFDPNDWGYDFCESSAWQNNFTVFHDIEGLINLFGSKENAEKRLDDIFTLKPKYNVGRYGFEIHEMTEVAILNLGYFAISNQPSFHLPFVYKFLNKENKLNEILKKTFTHFTSKSDGYPGDEDNGSLSAFVVFCAIGKYPFCPVDGLIEFEPVFNNPIITPLNIIK